MARIKDGSMDIESSMRCVRQDGLLSIKRGLEILRWLNLEVSRAIPYRGKTGLEH